MTLLGTANFKDNANAAMQDSDLQSELRKLAGGFSQARVRAAAAVPEFDALRDAARDIKNNPLDNLDYYLERLERKVRSEERRVGKQCVSPCRTWGAPEQ